MLILGYVAFGDVHTIQRVSLHQGPSALPDAMNGNAEDSCGAARSKLSAAAQAERQIAFAQERGRRDLNFIQTVDPALVVFKKGDDKVRLFLGEMADPGRSAPDTGHRSL